MGLDLLWRAGVKPAKVILGLGWYGRSFTLSDPSCNKPNGVCQFSGGALAGQCSNASGILTLQEINGVIDYNGVKPVWDKDAMVKWITWDDNQWVSYDDDDTFEQKRKFANSRCLGGTMVSNTSVLPIVVAKLIQCFRSGPWIKETRERIMDWLPLPVSPLVSKKTPRIWLKDLPPEFHVTRQIAERAARRTPTQSPR